MNHVRARELLLELAYGELAPGDAREVERHLAECAACGAEWESIAATRGAMARIGEEPRDDHRRAAILEAARAGISAPHPRRLRRSIWTIGATLVVAALVAGVTLKLSQERPLEHVADLGRVEEPGSRAAAEDEHVGPPVAPPVRPAPDGAAAPRKDARPRDAAASVAAPQTRAPVAKAPPAPRVRVPEIAATVGPEAAPNAGAKTAATAPARAADAATGAAPHGSVEPDRVSAGSIAIIASVEQLRAAGTLDESTRRLSCGGVALKQISWADGGRVLKIALHAPDGTVVEGWYDQEGRLRASEARRAGLQPDTARRRLDTAGRVVHEDSPHPPGDDDPLRWLPPRDPGSALAKGCEARAD